jgi:hypothetical protein
MNKPEMEAHNREYHQLLEKARGARQADALQEAIGAAVSSLEHIDGMIQYQRKYENVELVSLEGINLILEIAPLIFDFPSIETLEGFLKSHRRISKYAVDDPTGGAEMARRRMTTAHRVWDYLERELDETPERLAEKLNCEASDVRHLIEFWEANAILRRVPDGNGFRVRLATRMTESTLAKCSSCGAIAKAAKSLLLEFVSCPKCHRKVNFVIASM